MDEFEMSLFMHHHLPGDSVPFIYDYALLVWDGDDYYIGLATDSSDGTIVLEGPVDGGDVFKLGEDDDFYYAELTHSREDMA